VWSPSFVDGLRVSLDWYEIDIEDVIANLNATAIATGCFDNPNFNAADVPNANVFCSRIRRSSNGQIEGITTGFVNGGFLDFTGWQSQVVYSKDLSDWSIGGRGTIGLTAFKLDRLENSTNNVVTNVDAGEIGNSEYRGQLSLAYDRDRWGVNWQADYTGAAVINVEDTAETRDIRGAGAYWLHNAGASFKLGDQGVLRFAVTNVFDEEPPIPTLGLSAGTYDILGRRYTASINWKF
jgi:outer membrane receptor protein involved in Fe transport